MERNIDHPALISYMLTILICAVFTVSCNNEDTSDEAAEGVELTLLDDVTSITVRPDSNGLYLGTSGDSFYNYDIGHRTLSRYYLPNREDKNKIYTIYKLDDEDKERYIVGFRDMAAMYLEYPYENGAVHRPQTYIQLILPPTAPPDKGGNISVYNMMESDGVLYLGSSNGLLYLDMADISSLGDDIKGSQKAILKVVPAIEHFRSGHHQFRVESVVDLGDTLSLVTDSGEYLLAKKDRDIPGSERAVEDIQYRDTISAGNYTGRNERAIVGDKLYYVNDGRLHCHDNGKPTMEGREYVLYRVGEYRITDQNGVWRIDGNTDTPTFVGQISELPVVKGISQTTRGNELYFVTSDGIYKVAASKFVLPGTLKAEHIGIDEISDNESYKSILALDDCLLVGLRQGLFRVSYQGKVLSEYEFKTGPDGATLQSRFISPYVTRIDLNPEGGYRVWTLNQGVWHLKDLEDKTLTGGLGISDNLINNNSHSEKKAEGPRLKVYMPARPTLTWTSVRSRPGLLVTFAIAVCIILCAQIYFIRTRHKEAIRDVKRESLSLYDAIIVQLKQGLDDKRISSNAQIAKVFQNSLMSMQAYVEDSKEKNKKTAAEDAIHRLNRFCRNEIIANSQSLIASLPSRYPADGDEYLFSLMDDYRLRVEERTRGLIADNLSDNLRVAVQLYSDYRRFVSRVFAYLRQLQREGKGREWLTLDYMDKLWRVIVTFDKDMKLNASDYGLLETFTEIDSTSRPKWDDPTRALLSANVGQVTFSSLVFLNVAKPPIANVYPLQNSARSFYEFYPRRNKRGTENHGSIYKIIMRMISPSLLMGGKPAPVLPSIGDILWVYYFAGCHDQIVGLRPKPGEEKSLSSAILAAWQLSTTPSHK